MNARVNFTEVNMLKSRNKEEYAKAWLKRFDKIAKDHLDGEDILRGNYTEYRWLKNQRERKALGTLTKLQKELLDSLSKRILAPKKEEDRFYEKLELLKKFVQNHKRKPLRNGVLEDELTLANWLRGQRSKKCHTDKRAQEIIAVLCSHH